MLSDHDQDLLPYCRRLGHEMTFGYCRQESAGKPCRLILDCWWERFDVRSFLQDHFPIETMAQLEHAGLIQPLPKVVSLLELVQQTQKRLAENSDPGNSPQPGA